MMRGSRAWVFIAGAFFARAGVSAMAGDWIEAAGPLAVAVPFLWLGAPTRPVSEPAPPDDDTVEDPDEDASHAFAQGLARDRETLAPLDEAALGYRTQLIADGWSSDAAEHMALAFYGTQLSMLTNAIIGPEED